MSARAIVVLVEPAADADRITTWLTDRAVAGLVSVRRPPNHLLGAGFWAEPDAEGWWSDHGLDTGEVITVIGDRPGLERDLSEIDSEWAVWCSDDGAGAYSGLGHVVPLTGRDVEDFAAALTATLSSRGWEFRSQPLPTWGPFRRRHAGGDASQPTRATAIAADAAMVTNDSDVAESAATVGLAVGDDTPPPPIPVRGFGWEAATAARRAEEAPHRSTTTATVARRPIPREATDDGDDGAPLLTAAPLEAVGRPTAPIRHAVADRLRTFLGSRRREPDIDIARIGQGLVGLHDTIVVVGSRKGGVGKTTESLGLGFLGAQAVEALGGCALLLDANLTNADVSVQLRLSASAPTVRDLVKALMTNAPAPTPVSALGTALSVYGENRETERYTPLEIDTLARHARAYYTLTVVDLPNATPGIEDKSEAVVDAWLPHADVVVIPLDTSAASFEGAADMLRAISDLQASGRLTRGSDVVVSFLSPRDLDVRRLRPELSATLDQLEALGATVVDVPGSPRLALIDWGTDPTPLTEADPAVTQAYWRILASVVAARRARV